MMAEEQDCSLGERSLRAYKYKICPHCDKELNLKKFREHKQLYYDCDAKWWCKQDRKELSSDESELSGFEFEDIDICVSNDQPEQEQCLDFEECFADLSEEGMNVVSVLQSSTVNSEGYYPCHYSRH